MISKNRFASKGTPSRFGKGKGVRSLSLSEYAAAREKLLARIGAGLESDPRFAAAWLIGSYGRGEQDAVSDIDLVVVIADDYQAELCDRAGMTASGAPAARMALFRAFGEPVNIHENHHNAPPGGTFSAVLYRDPPVIVDWTLAPRALAYRPEPTRVLFDRAGIPSVPPAPAQPPAAQETYPAAPSIEERTAFFWMMAAVTAKYIVRGHRETAQELLAFLSQIAAEIETLRRQPPVQWDEMQYPTRVEQSARVRALCDQIETPAGVLTSPREQVEAILKVV